MSFVLDQCLLSVIICTCIARHFWLCHSVEPIGHPSLRPKFANFKPSIKSETVVSDKSLSKSWFHPMFQIGASTHDVILIVPTCDANNLLSTTIYRLTGWLTTRCCAMCFVRFVCREFTMSWEATTSSLCHYHCYCHTLSYKNSSRLAPPTKLWSVLVSLVIAAAAAADSDFSRVQDV